MEPSSHPGSRKLSGHATALRRQWWIVALAAFGGLAAATAYTAGVPATYTSSATVNVHALSTDSSQPVGGRATGAVDLQTEVQVIQSATVASLAKQISRSPRSVPALVSRISVTVPANSQVLQISCAEHTAEAATRCAHAFAAAYLQNRSATANGLIQTQLSALQRESAALQQTITALTLKIKSLSRGSSERITLTTELGADNTQLNLLSSQIAGLVGQSANTSGGRIITDAAPPQRPAGPGPWLYLPCGLAAGLVIGLVLALWRGRSDKRVRGASDVETAAHLPVLLDLSRGKARPRLTLAEPRSRTGQAFAELAHTLVATLGRGNHVVLVAGASPGHGGSMASANLAAALARTGSEAILVCADLRGSITPALFGLTPGPGLAQIVIDRATVGEVERQPAEVPQLRVITPGVDGHLANYHLQRNVTERLVNLLRARARYVILEAPPTGDGADAYALAPFVDAAIMAVEVPRSLRDEVRAGVRQLDRMGAAVLGAVLLPSLGRAPRLPAGPPSPAEDRPASDLPATELAAAELRAPEPRAPEPRDPDPLDPDPWDPGPQTLEPHATRPQATGRHVTGPRDSEAWATEPRDARVQAADRIEPRGMNRYGEPYAAAHTAENLEPPGYLVFPPHADPGGVLRTPAGEARDTIAPG